MANRLLGKLRSRWIGSELNNANHYLLSERREREEEEEEEARRLSAGASIQMNRLWRQQPVREREDLLCLAVSNSLT